MYTLFTSTRYSIIHIHGTYTHTAISIGFLLLHASAGEEEDLPTSLSIYLSIYLCMYLSISCLCLPSHDSEAVAARVA